jgi:hypothetical protein
MLFKKTDIAPLAVFRILMGLLMAAEGFGAILTGWVRRNYVEPEFTFNFIGFDFLQVLVGPQAYVVYFLLGVFGLGVAAGYRYRLSIIGYTLLWTAVYLGQKTSYNNHYYLLMLVCMLFCIIPAHRFASADVKSGRVPKATAVPYWTVWIFKVLLLIVYLYASLAKFYPDWLEGKPIELFLSGKKDWPVLGPLVDKHWFIMLLSYGGIAFDALIIPGLWYKPTRKVAFAFAIFFHLFNSIVFHIGIFPYMMLITSVLFFEQETIRSLFFRNSIDLKSQKMYRGLKPQTVKLLLYPFLAVMILLPLRPFYFPGSSHWTEKGHRLSWHMMLRSKYGRITFKVYSQEGKFLKFVDPYNEVWGKHARRMATRPDMAWQYVQRLKEEFLQKGHKNVEIYATSDVSLNGRNYQPLIDGDANLTEAEWSVFGHDEWILLHPDL